MKKPSVFVQIYNFYPTFGQKPKMCFCDLTIFKEVEKVIGQKMSIFASRN